MVERMIWTQYCQVRAYRDGTSMSQQTELIEIYRLASLTIVSLAKRKEQENSQSICSDHNTLNSSSPEKGISRA